MRRSKTTIPVNGSIFEIFVHLESTWKAKYGGLSVSELARIKELERENARLKRMYADLSLVHHALKDAVEKKV